MLRKMKPVKLSEKAAENISGQLQKQEETTAAPKSLDPKRFPVHEIPVGVKELIYVPNHTYLDEEGKEHLRMDKPLIHAAKDGRRFLYFRCIQGIVDDEAGFDGTCPLCEATSDAWDLANYQIKEDCEARGLNPEDKENKQVKDIRSSRFNDMVLKNAQRYYTFPIVVFQTEKNLGKTPIYDEKGSPIFQIMWYTISEAQYNKKWVTTLEAMEDDPSHPGGHFFLLDYSFTPKNGEPNKRDAAQNLAVHARTLFKGEAGDKVRATLDKLTEDWTPEKAMETVINNLLYSPEDLDEAQETIMSGTRNMLNLFKARDAKNLSGEIEDNNSGFKLEKKEDDIPDGGVDLTGDVDEEGFQDGIDDEEFGALTE